MVISSRKQFESRLTSANTREAEKKQLIGGLLAAGEDHGHTRDAATWIVRINGD